MNKKNRIDPRNVAGLVEARARQARFAPITEDVLRGFADSGSYSQGRSYSQGGYIFDTILRGDTLHARSQGHSGGPYRIEITLAPKDSGATRPIIDFECSCPRGDFCKHIVATLLIWINQPQAFEVREDMASRLQELGRDELLSILTTLLKLDPDLDARVERLLPAVQKTPGSGGKATVNPLTIQRQVQALFGQSHYDWYGDYDDGNSEQFDELIGLGDQYAASGQWANAVIVYSQFAKAAIEQYEEWYTEDDSLSEAITACGEGLIKCLEAQAAAPAGERLDPSARNTLLRTLYDLWSFNQSYDFDLDERVVAAVAEGATPAERQMVEGWLKKDLRGNIVEREAVQFLLALRERDGISDEEILALYRENALYSDLVARLIELGRADEAMAVADEYLAGWGEATQFAGQLLTLGGDWVARGLAFVEARLRSEEATQRAAAQAKQPQSYQDRERDQVIAHYLEWLQAQYLAHGQLEQGLEMALRRFEIQPALRTYDAAKEAALYAGQPPAVWNELRPRLLGELEAQDLWKPLVEIYLREGSVREMLDALTALEAQQAAPPAQVSAGGWISTYAPPLSDLQQRVARMAEKRYPDEARAIYQRLAEALIEGRGRANYAAAAEHLIRVRDLYKRQDDLAGWTAYLAALRQKNKTLRALREELDSRGLT